MFGAFYCLIFEDLADRYVLLPVLIAWLLSLVYPSTYRWHTSQNLHILAE